MAAPIETFLGPNFTNLLITLVIPFLTIFTVLFVGLRMTKVFGTGRSVYFILSVGITIMVYAVKPQAFAFLASYLLQIGIASIIIVVVGVLAILTWGVLTKVERLVRNDQQRLQNLEKLEQKLQKKYYTGGIFGSSVGEKISIAKQMEEIEREKKFLLAKMRRLR